MLPLLEMKVPIYDIKQINFYSNNPLNSRQNNKLKVSVRSFLKERLPEYMIPSNLVFIDGMPITANGKFDRNVIAIIKRT